MIDHRKGLNMTTEERKRLLWLDLETTGFDPRKDHILEVHARCAEEITEPFRTTTVSHACIQVPIGVQFKRALGLLSPAVEKMHRDNNLWRDCAKRGRLIEEVDQDLSANLSYMSESKWHLAGFSVHFDLGFIRERMPLTAALLSHQVYDVSAVKLFCLSLGMPSEMAKKDEAAHRASPDVSAAIHTAKRLARWLSDYDGRPRFPVSDWTDLGAR